MTASWRSGGREDKGSGPVCNEVAMGSPLTPRGAVSRSGWRRAGAAALGLLLLIAAAMPGRAQDAEDPYTATVKVDATADSAANAREAARIDGQRRALAAVIERLSGASEPAKPPEPG